jgi:hypothetical protein
MACHQAVLWISTSSRRSKTNANRARRPPVFGRRRDLERGKQGDGYKSSKGSAVSRGALMLGGYLLCFSYYCGHAEVYVVFVRSHGVDGTTGPLLLMASMQVLYISWMGRCAFPEGVEP